MEIRKFSGIHNRTSPERMNPGDLVVGQDIDIDDSGRIMSRRGLTQKLTTPCHSIYNAEDISYIVANGNMNQLNADFSLSPITALRSNTPVSYDSVASLTLYSNGVDKGRLAPSGWSSWGVDTPTGQPIATPDVGVLPPGRYLYALTFRRDDGHESGTGVAGVVDVASGGILFSNIEVSTNPHVSRKYLYMSAANGQVLYRVMTMPNGQTQATYRNSGMDLGIPLTTQFAGPPPANASIIRIFAGIAYCVVGDVIYYSDPYNYDLFRYDSSFLRLPGPVAHFEAVNDGVYVASVDVLGEDGETTGATFFFGGTRPDKFDNKIVFDYGAIPNTCVKTDASYFEPPVPEQTEASYPAVVWGSRHGVMVGFDGGKVQNLTEARYSFPGARRGAAFLRQQRGIVQYIASLQGVGSANNAYSETIY